MVEPMYFEAIVVDGEMPMDKQHLDEEVFEILAPSEAHARIAVTLVRGDRSEVARIEEVGDVDDDGIIEELETEIAGQFPTINAYEVFEQAGFRGSFYDGDEWVKSDNITTLESVFEWYRSHPDSNDNADEIGERTTLCIDGWSSVGGESFVYDVSTRYAEPIVN